MVNRDVGTDPHDVAELNPTLETLEVSFPDYSQCVAMLRFNCDVVLNFLDG